MRVNPQTHPALDAIQAASVRSSVLRREKPEAVDRSLVAGATNEAAGDQDNKELRKTFESFVGQTLFGQMLQSMRKTVGKPAYFHGGRAEEIFTKQLDQVLGEKMANASAETFTGPMLDLFMAARK